MGKIGFGYGSEWHLLRYLGYHRDYLTNQVLQLTGGQDITWLDFNFSKVKDATKDDKELIGLEFIDDEEVRRAWQSYWPKSGNAQNWDTVGKIHYQGETEWLLVEAKAHLGEVKSECGATNPKSIQQINASLQKTMDVCGVQSTSLNKWLGPYYQYANRLAVLNFLMQECDPAIPTRLLYIYFTGDKREDSAECPQIPDEWLPVIEEMESWLGLPEDYIFSNRVHHLFLPVRPV